MTTMDRVQESIAAMPEGEPFSPAAFLTFGSRAAVDQALSRMVRRGQIVRVTRGLYVRPKASRWIGRVAPEPARIARAIAEAAGAKVEVHGAEAARHFGFTTQMPTQPVFLTTGPNRRFRLGNLECTLIHTNARKLALAGRPAGLALVALWYLGKEQVSASTIRQIQAKLEPGEFEALKRAPMPGWLMASFQSFERLQPVG